MPYENTWDYAVYMLLFYPIYLNYAAYSNFDLIVLSYITTFQEKYYKHFLSIETYEFPITVINSGYLCLKLCQMH